MRYTSAETRISPATHVRRVARSGILRKLGEGKTEVGTVSALKLLVHPAITLGLALLLGLPPFLTGIAVMQAAMPIAANVFIMAQGYEVYVRRSSSAILISTFAAVITLSAVILVLLSE